jgi:hypothetical protein
MFIFENHMIYIGTRRAYQHEPRVTTHISLATHTHTHNCLQWRSACHGSGMTIDMTDWVGLLFMYFVHCVIFSGILWSTDPCLQPAIINVWQIPTVCTVLLMSSEPAQNM